MRSSLCPVYLVVNITMDRNIKTLEEALAVIAKQDEVIALQGKTIASLETQLRLALSEKFVPKKERMPQEALNEAESTEPDPILPVVEADEEIAVSSYTRKKTGRKPLPESLPRVTFNYDLEEHEKICACGYHLTSIGEETSEQLEYIPARIQVIRHVRVKYACKNCEFGVKTAVMPKQPIPKSISTPSLLAQIAIAKYQDHLPLYRQEIILQRHGIDILRGTLCHWMIKCGELLKPIYDLIIKNIYQYDIAYADETPTQVLKEPGRDAEAKSYVWVFIGGPSRRRSIIYHYSPTRGMSGAHIILNTFKGYLHSDAYTVYQKAGKTQDIINVYCMAHARRNFFKVSKLSKNKNSVSNQIIKHIKNLYKLEEKCKRQGLSPGVIKDMRQQYAKPELEMILNKIKSVKVPAESMLGKAIEYFIKYYDGLCRYLDDGRLEIDNNRSERAVKTFVIGRKNFLFYDSVKGAESSMIIYSVIETAKANGIEPWAYLNNVFKQLPLCENEMDVEKLLPYL